MNEETKKTAVEIETLQKIKKSLEEDIAKLQVIHNNLEAQAHTAEVKGEQETKLADLEKMNKYAAEERRLEAKRLETEARIDMLEKSEANLNERTKEIERREQKLIDLEAKVAELNLQRSNFEAYKVSVNAQLDQAKETIAVAQESFDKIKADNDMLAGREARVKELERIWNDEIGKLEVEKKKFQIERENFIGLNKVKEEQNV
jgi:hypothetical protein